MSAEKKPSTLTSIGPDWGNIILGVLQFGEPAAVCAEYDKLFAENDPVAVKDAAGIPYYMAHGGAQIGTVAWDWHTDIPTQHRFSERG